MAHLREICAQAEYRNVVYGEWGFDRKLSLGKGLNMLFVGPPGTGKTMAAEVIAHELQLDLYRIDLSQVVSKYIGESEKNLDRIFTAAENSNSILFFDEADALFGKRSEVRDSHDRYANIEISYLLQKMEEYQGISVLATNLRQNLDDAFMRRVQAVVEFPFPDAEYRQRIWNSVFPQEAPLHDDVDFKLLAHEVQLAGGNIKNMALAAAFYAAGDGGSIRMEHLIQAARREHQKIGRSWNEAGLRQKTVK
jgi:SpoVK/Ycf46/Vps4 family AAA+-type ATPase